MSNCDHKQRQWMPYPFVRLDEQGQQMFICFWYCACGASGEEIVADYPAAEKLIGGGK